MVIGWFLRVYRDFWMPWGAFISGMLYGVASTWHHEWTRWEWWAALGAGSTFTGLANERLRAHRKSQQADRELDEMTRSPR